MHIAKLLVVSFNNGKVDIPSNTQQPINTIQSPVNNSVLKPLHCLYSNKSVRFVCGGMLIVVWYCLSGTQFPNHWIHSGPFHLQLCHFSSLRFCQVSQQKFQNSLRSQKKTTTTMTTHSYQILTAISSPIPRSLLRLLMIKFDLLFGNTLMVPDRLGVHWKQVEI